MSEHFREGFVRGPKGLRLYWRIDGDGGEPLVCCNGIGNPISYWEPFAARMSARFQVVRWDWRGHGRSDSPRDSRDVSIASCADDLTAVLDGLNLQRAVLLGHSMAAQVLFELYRREPARVAAMVPTLGFHRSGVANLFDTKLSLVGLQTLKRAADWAPSLLAMVSRPVLMSPVSDKLARLTGLIGHLAPRELMTRHMENLVRIDWRSFVALAEDMQRYDATSILPALKVPVLVVAGEKDLFVPLRVAHEMVALIPGAELLIIPGGTHAALIEQPDLLTLRVAKFLDERVFPEPRPAKVG